MKDKEDKFGYMQAYARYFSLTFQMIVIIVMGGFGGRALDTWLNNGKSLFVVIFIVLAAFLSFYLYVRTILKK